MHLWNKEYPATLAHKTLEDFEAYLATLSYCKHYLLVENTAIFAWGFEFDRNEERWFALIVDENEQGKRIGSQLLNRMKHENKTLNGWVIDHSNAKMSDGSFYRSPMTFYLKNGFAVLVALLKLLVTMAKNFVINYLKNCSHYCKLNIQPLPPTTLNAILKPKFKTKLLQNIFLLL
jgi:GNAT superfamily N-acetyltransferase